MNNKSLSTIVDDNDVVIAHKHWTKVQPSDRVRISAIWLVNSKGEILMAQRSHHKKHQPNLWGPAAAGTVEKNETYETNAYKELAEEIGVSGIPLTLVSIKKWDGDEADHRFCACYKGTIDWSIEKFKLQEEEVSAVKWISKVQLLKELDTSPELYLPNTQRWITLFNLV